MNILIRILRTFLYFNIISPIHMHYIFADKPNAGYVSINNGMETHHPVGLAAKQRRYMGLSGNAVFQMTNEDRGIDKSKITRSPHEHTHHEHQNNRNHAANQGTTELPQEKPQKTEDDHQQKQRNLKALRSNTRTTIQSLQITPQIVPPNKESKKEYKPTIEIREPTYQRNLHNAYDNKGNILQVNVHKTQIAADPQIVKLNSHRQLTALSVQRRDDHYKRGATSVLVDRKLQKSTSFKERNSQIMSRVLDDMTKKISDRRIKNIDFRKRDADNSNENSHRNVVSDSMKKYIGKDVNNMLNAHPISRVGSSEVEIEDNSAPYALFYRMAPESLDNREGLYLMNSMEKKAEVAFASKDKHLAVNYQNEVDLKKLKTSKNYNTVKLKNKMKNFSNFRNN